MNAPHYDTALSPVYLLSLLGLAAYWLWQMAGLGKQRSWPRLGILMPLGLGALLGAPAAVLDVPALFGMGLGFCLIAAYFPLTTLRRAPTQGHWLGAAALLLLGLLGLSMGVANRASVLALVSLAGLLHGLGMLLWAWRYPRSGPRAAAPSLPPPSRWQHARLADPPDLQLTLDAQQARVLNTSPYLLEVLGWSPARHNAWWPLRQAGGQTQSKLLGGQTGYLLGWEPLAPGNGGVRLWYTRDGGPEVYLFSANWQDPLLPEQSQGRVLN